jgi:hypothetical protein
MLAHLDDVGVRVPVAATQLWGGGSLFALPSLTRGGIIDVHSYDGAEILSRNPRAESSLVHVIGTASLHGRPVACTEWNTPVPRVDRFTTPLNVMAVGSLQGWDAPMIYAYAQESSGNFTSPGRMNTWSSYSDAALTALMPAAAIAFRQGHVQPAREHYCLMPSVEDVFHQSIKAETSATIRTLMEQHRLTLAMPETGPLDWLEPARPGAGVTVVRDVHRDFIPEGQTFVESDTGEIRRDWVEGVQTIDTPMTQAAQGWIGGSRRELRDVTFAIETPKAAAVVTALDGQPIGQSGRLLITTVARVVAAPRNAEALSYSEPVTGTVTVRSGTSGLKLKVLSGDGSQREAPVQQQGGAYVIDLAEAGGTHWYLLER